MHTTCKKRPQKQKCLKLQKYKKHRQGNSPWRCSFFETKSSIEVPAQKAAEQRHYTDDKKHNARQEVHPLVRNPIGNDSGSKSTAQGKEYTTKHFGPISKERKTWAEQNATNRSCERDCSHNQHARTYCAFEIVSKHDGQNHQHNHAATRANHTAIKADKTATHNRHKQFRAFRAVNNTARCIV